MLPNCHDDVVAAFAELRKRHGDRSCSSFEVYEQMRERGAQYAEPAVCTTMKRIKEPDPRGPDVMLDRAGKNEFQLLCVVAA